MIASPHRPVLHACRGARCGGKRYPAYYVHRGLCLDCRLAQRPPRVPPYAPLPERRGLSPGRR